MTKQLTSTGKLKICKASAGSGKTFKLAVEYIKHLVMDPTAYRHILAVTFTNKATNEMKTRILSQLYGISNALPDSNDYLESLKSDETIRQWYEKESGKPADGRENSLEGLIRTNCGKALTFIIHEYHCFRIETIDSFFQSIVRELARDLNLTANLRVDLDNEAALKEGVAAVIDSVVTDRQTAESVFQFVNARMEDNKNWTIDKELEKFGKNIFNENFLQLGAELRRKLEDPRFLPHFQKCIRELKDDAVRPLKEKGERFMRLCDEHGLGQDDFAQKSGGVFPFFSKLAKGEIKNARGEMLTPGKKILNFLDPATAWSKDERVRNIVEAENMISLLAEAVNALEVARCVISTVDAMSRHINALALINTISKKVDEVTSQRGDFLLSNTNHFLHAMIAESDVPFIYERTGTRFDHIMIDEFQDTSMLQWENFKPLLRNCLDSDNECLVVGDVKQSIYRWRNGEWSILNGLQDDPSLKQYVNPDPLHTNYRSDYRVVAFNNTFFGRAAAELSNGFESDMPGASAHDIRQAYENCAQKIPDDKPKTGGYVRVECMRKSDETADEQSIMGLDEFELWQCHRLNANVRMLLEQGIPQSQICILVRTRNQIAMICDYFDNHVETFNGERVRVVSTEAYQLGASPAVRLIVQALKMIQQPENRLQTALFLFYYKEHVLGRNPVTECGDIFLKPQNELSSLLPEKLMGKLDEIAMVPLYERCERLYDLLDLHRIAHQDSYLFAFYDQLGKYLNDNATDVDSFLRYWDDKLAQKTITDGTVDGIRIMTIHKAKGLEFHSVLLPFADWTVKDTYAGSMLWCVPKVEPFNQLPLCPVKASKELDKTIFTDDYREELLKQYVDSLNLLYVAFTRATHNLIVISDLKKAAAKADSPSTSYATMYDLLRGAMPEDVGEAGEIIMTSDDAAHADVYEYRDSSVVGFKTKEKTTRNVLLAKPQPVSVGFDSRSSNGEFRQSNGSKLFIAGKDDDDPEVKYQNEGLLFHAILSQIRTVDQLDKVVRQLDLEGCFADSYYRDNVKKLIRQALWNPICQTWFNPRWTVINECSIVFKDKTGITQSRRPDRVITDGKETIVIDYKTGRHQKEEYTSQVKVYMDLLEQMGYPNVTGYLWYIRLNSIEPVK